MICVSIGRGRHRHMIAEHKHLVEQGAKLVELRLDYIDRAVNIKRLLPDRPCPVVIAVRRKEDGGKWAGTEDQRQVLLRTAIADGVEWVDLEEDVATKIPRFGKTKRIVSLHDFGQTPVDLEEIHARLAALDADVVKIACMANHPHDNVRMLELVKKAKVPTVAFCMGDIGTISRVLLGKFGAPWTYATFSSERSLAPGQLSYKQMTEIYRYDKIGKETEVYGVIADPVGHSLSPVIHNGAFEQLQLDKVYVPCRVTRDHLDAFLDDCPALGIRGLSVTIPHKEAVLKRLGKADGAVKGIGAANTILWEGSDTIGYNTDYRAAMEGIDAATGGSEANEMHLKGKIALMLGAGGVSKAVVFGLKRRGADVVIANRHRERAEALAGALDARVVDWDKRHTVEPHIIVNGTPVGMHPNVNESPFNKGYFESDMTVFDTVYNPEQTLLLKEAKAAGCKIVTGTEMFVRQAGLQFKLFTGQEPPLETMREALKRAIGPAKY